MSFGWLIWLLVFLFFLGNDSRIWGSMWGDRGDYVFGRSGRLGGRKQSNFEIRKAMRKRVEPEVVTVTAADHIESPDPHMEDLIARGELGRAREYRLELEKIAEEMDDDTSLRKYAIYGARIARRQKELDRAKAEKQYQKYMEIPSTSGRKAAEVDVQDTIEAAETIDKTPAPSGGRGVLPPLWGAKTETGTKATPLYPPPISREKETPRIPEPDTEGKDDTVEIDPEDYGDLISI